MTNGEKFKEVFGVSQVNEGELYAFAWLSNYDVPAEFYIDWWNAEYKAKGFLPKFNKILKTITPQEPTTKNDLEVLRDTLVGRDILVGFKQGVDSIRALPSVTPQEPKTGHWINIEDRTDWYDAAYKCSYCGREIITPYELKNNLYSDYPYCHCGAQMIEPQESEEI